MFSQPVPSAQREPVNQTCLFQCVIHEDTSYELSADTEIIISDAGKPLNNTLVARVDQLVAELLIASTKQRASDLEKSLLKLEQQVQHLPGLSLSVTHGMTFTYKRSNLHDDFAALAEAQVKHPVADFSYEIKGPTLLQVSIRLNAATFAEADKVFRQAISVTSHFSAFTTRDLCDVFKHYDAFTKKHGLELRDPARGRSHDDYFRPGSNMSY